MITNLEITIPEEFIEAGQALGFSQERIEGIFNEYLYLILTERIIPMEIEEMIESLEGEDPEG